VSVSLSQAKKKVEGKKENTHAKESGNENPNDTDSDPDLEEPPGEDVLGEEERKRNDKSHDNREGTRRPRGSLEHLLEGWSIDLSIVVGNLTRFVLVDEGGSLVDLLLGRVEFFLVVRRIELW